MHGLSDSIKQSSWRFTLVSALIVVATVLHYTIDVQAGAVHDILLRSYYVPIVLAGLWFGTRGGLVAAFAVSIVFFPHAIHGWDAPYTWVFRLIEILMYYVIGGLTGWLSSRTRFALEAEKQAGFEREEAHEGLKRKTLELFEMEEELRRSERLAALGRMSGGLAHEIRNPLASIKTSVEMLQEQSEQRMPLPHPDLSIDLLAVVAEETDRLDRILTEFLKFARAEAQLENGSPSTCILEEVLNGTVDLVHRNLIASGVITDFDAKQLKVSVLVGGDHLRQIFLNLLLNACDAMPNGGVIRIGIAGATHDAITLAIEDSGHGVPRNVAKSIFDPFFSTKEGGVGLGLSIVARLIEACDGTIKLDPNYNAGARFLVTLPKTAR